MIYNILGYTGSLMILTSFILVTKQKWQPTAFWYLFINLLGGLFLAIYQLRLEAYAGFALNLVFAMVALDGLLLLLKKK
jgi:lipid-A-disaccharide synthase-like uncharacterized protein